MLRNFTHFLEMLKKTLSTLSRTAKKLNMAFDCKKTMHFIAQKAHTPVQPLFDHVMKFVIIIDCHCIWILENEQP